MAGLGYGCRGGEESDQVLSDTGLTVGELWLLAGTVLQLGISIHTTPNQTSRRAGEKAGGGKKLKIFLKKKHFFLFSD